MATATQSLIDPATDAERARLREETDDTILLAGSNSSNPRFHVPKEVGSTRPLCGYGEGRRKPLTSYPVGWFPWCRSCLHEWREGDR